MRYVTTSKMSVNRICSRSALSYIPICHIFLKISPSKKSGALSLESDVALGSAIRLAWENRLSETCLKRSGQKT